MRSMSQVALQHDLHNELQLRYREFFESRLAVFLLGKVELFSAVKKITASILYFITDYKQKIIRQIFMDHKIQNELYDVSYFGHLPRDASHARLPEEILTDMVSTLENKNAPLSQVMQIHCIFVYRIYDHLAGPDDKLALIKQYFPEMLQGDEKRGRIEREEKVSLTTQLGISRHPVFKKLIGQDAKRHLRAVDRFSADVASPYYQKVMRQNVPFVAGRSGHTRSLLLGALLYGKLTSDELKEYVLAIFVFLAAGGNHSFHEVMQVAEKVGVPSDEKNYSVSLPNSFKQSEQYKFISRIFPEYLADQPVLRLQENYGVVA